ncbi:MAG: hypothetical protein ACRDA3_06645 [Peptostreptococcaceae bacterium]
MSNKFLSKERVFIQTTKYADILVESTGYTDFHKKIIESKIDYNDQKTYEIAQSGFVDFNQHLYENENEMNSISSGIYLEKSLITFRIFLWGAKGEGFEIFKHALVGEEINSLNTIDDIKEYVYLHLSELESGILNTYGEEERLAFEKLGLGLEERKLPLANILQDISVSNNMNDFK